MRFDADTGRLDVVPDAPAYGTKLRWSAPKLIAAANAEVPGANVRSLHVLPPVSVDAGSASAAADPGLRPAAPEAPVRTRETASPGYQRALAACQASRPEPVLDPRTAAAIEQQNAGSSMREPEEAFGDGQAAIEELRVKAARTAATFARCGEPVLSGLASHQSPCIGLRHRREDRHPLRGLGAGTPGTDSRALTIAFGKRTWAGLTGLEE
ncbi:hypothetical protein ACK1X7_47760 [Streptomyces sp. CY1]|uniref:hypothetical protein n=1 Tax=Streptomyces sp. CY1 TaxID=3388313 RepID=UPI0039A36C80